MSHVLDQLHLISKDALLFHEMHEQARLEETAQSILTEGFLRHPPLVVALHNREYVIIDGAHRTGALSQIGCARIPVQIVDLSDVRIGSWDHLVPEGTWLTDLQSDEELMWMRYEPGMIKCGEPLADVLLAEGRYLIYPAQMQEDWEWRSQMWHRIVGSYMSMFQVNRLPSGALKKPVQGQALMRYPRVSLYEIERSVLGGNMLPAGVTRFSVSGRLLNLRIPLQILLDPKHQVDLWKDLLQKWQGSLRLYSEPVYLNEN